MSNKYNVSIKYDHPVTSGGTNDRGQAYQSEHYDRGFYTETFTRTTSKSGSAVQKYHDKNLKRD